MGGGGGGKRKARGLPYNTKYSVLEIKVANRIEANSTVGFKATSQDRGGSIRMAKDHQLQISIGSKD